MHCFRPSSLDRRSRMQISIFWNLPGTSNNYVAFSTYVKRLTISGRELLFTNTVDSLITHTGQTKRYGLLESMGFAQDDSRQTNNLGIAKMYGFSESMGYAGYGLRESQLY